MRKLTKKNRIIIITAAVALVCFVGVFFVQTYFAVFSRGNAVKYNLKHVEVLPENELSGKSIAFLGSSVTLGFAALNTSFADYVGKRNGCSVVKEAVSGTCLVDNGKKSYIARMKNMDKAAHFDVFICQLSTNDATKKMPIGDISPSRAPPDFDTQTVVGAIEYIAAYAQSTWGAKVVFFTNSYYDNAEYAAMVAALLELAPKWDIAVIDMYSDVAFNDVTDTERKLYMNDDIHPTRAGYLLWWTPYVEARLLEIVSA